jgi:hypothetical protein
VLETRVAAVVAEALGLTDPGGLRHAHRGDSPSRAVRPFRP